MIEKEIITDPHLACVLQRTRLTGDPAFLSRLKLYVLCAPHLEIGGAGNNAYVMEVAGRELLMAEKRRNCLALAATVGSIVLSVPLSLVLREKWRGHRFFRLVILVPLVVPGLIGALGLLLFWGPRGWFNLFLLRWVPGIGHPVPVDYTLHGLVLFYVWLYFPYTCVTTLSSLESLDRGIEEAGEVAGASRWQVLRHVVLPLIRPGILAGSVLTFMAAFGAFSVPLIAGRQ